MNWKSRKLILTVVLAATATIFLVSGSTDFSGWADFVKWVFVTYAGGNVGEHYVANKKQ